MNLSLFIAKRYLVSKKSTNAINIISAISVLGVCIGTMALVVVLSAFNGLSDLVMSLYNSFEPDLKITLNQGKVFDAQAEEMQALKKMEGVVFFTEVLEENAAIRYRDQQCLVRIKGVGEDYVSMSRFDTLVKEGAFYLQREEDAVNYTVIGQGISYLLNVGADHNAPLTVYAPKRGRVASINPEDAISQLNAYTAGVFSINDDFDFNYAIFSIDFARKLFAYEDQSVSAIELGLDSKMDKEALQENIQAFLGEKYVVKNRYQQNEFLFKTLKSEKLWTFIILAFILIVATFNVIGSLTMLIIEKKKDVSTLHDMGADIQLIRRIFLIEGMMITFIGAMVGLLLGLALCWAQIQFSLITFEDGYVVDAYPISVQTLDIFLVLAAVMAIGLFAAWYPVRVFTKKHLVRIRA